MDTVPKPKRGQRKWTDAQRAEQARKTRERQIWLKSTGPKTNRGKSTSSRNSYKHGSFTYEKKILRWYLRFAIMRNNYLKTYLNYENLKRENELRDKYCNPHPPRPDIRAFYPYFKVHPLTPKPKQPKKRNDLHEAFDYFTSLSTE